MRDGKIIELFGLRKTAGEIGIEIEMEGTGLEATQQDGAAKDPWPWEYKMDGSLRGESCEWVLHRPVHRPRVDDALDRLWAAKARVLAEFRPSRRCGVHVHLNVQQLTEKQVFVLVGTYIAFENLMVRWAGKDREGNLFCLRSSDAREFIELLGMAQMYGGFGAILGDHMRYASLNLNSLQRFGSLEFRSLPSPDKPQRIKQWVQMICNLKDFSLEIEDLRDLLYAMSAGDPDGLIMRVFGAKSPLRLIPDRAALLKEGMRNLQDLLVCKAGDRPRVINHPEGFFVGHDRNWGRGVLREDFDILDPIPDDEQPEWEEMEVDDDEG